MTHFILINQVWLYKRWKYLIKTGYLDEKSSVCSCVMAAVPGAAPAVFVAKSFIWRRNKSELEQTQRCIFAETHFTAFVLLMCWRSSWRFGLVARRHRARWTWNLSSARNWSGEPVVDFLPFSFKRLTDWIAGRFDVTHVWTFSPHRGDVTGCDITEGRGHSSRNVQADVILGGLKLGSRCSVNTSTRLSSPPTGAPPASHALHLCVCVWECVCESVCVCVPAYVSPWVSKPIFGVSTCV